MKYFEITEGNDSVTFFPSNLLVCQRISWKNEILKTPKG